MIFDLKVPTSLARLPGRTVCHAGRPPSGVDHHRSKLTPELVAEIRRRLEAGQLQKAVAIDLDLSPKTVSDVHTGKTWRGA